MSKYKLWVHYNTQNADSPRNDNEYSIVFETETDFTELFIRKIGAEKNDNKAFITKDIELEVDIA